MRPLSFLAPLFAICLGFTPLAEAAVHQVDSTAQLDVAFWSGLQDGDVISLESDISLSAQPVLTNKNVAFKSDSGAVRVLNVGGQRLVWANAAGGPTNAVTLDGVKLTGGEGNSVGGALRANLISRFFSIEKAKGWPAPF